MAGRPSSFQPEFIEQAKKLCELGATDRELAAFSSRNRSGDGWLAACLVLIRQDRNGVIAAQKRKRSDWRRSHLKANQSQRIRNATGARLWAALKGRTDGALFSRLGYSADDLCRHLEAQFTDGMTWSCYGKWHVDHIRPCASFDQTDPVQFSECWALGNLQPLWAAANIKKGGRHV